MKREDAEKRTAEAVKELVQALEQGRSDTLVAYLATMSKFHHYSFGNCLLIAIQRPDATRVAGFQRWKELRRQVKKGERGIAIFAPMAYRKQEVDEDEEEEKRSGKGRGLRGFRVVHVFDISQTEGEDLPEFAGIAGEPGAALEKLETIVRGHAIELEYGHLAGTAEGVSQLGKIVIRAGLAPAETFSVLCHEFAHELLHQKERRQQASKRVLETEAEAVAFVVSKAIGLDGTTRSADYIQLYAGGKETLLESLDAVQKTAALIIEALEAGHVCEDVSYAA